MPPRDLQEFGNEIIGLGLVVWIRDGEITSDLSRCLPSLTVEGVIIDWRYERIIELAGTMYDIEIWNTAPGGWISSLKISPKES
jgi:hypothetical protein